MEHNERMERREERREAGKGGLMIFGIIILVIFLLFVISFGTTWGQLQMDKIFKPQFKELERDIWEETPSRVLGAQQEIAKSMVEYNNGGKIMSDSLKIKLNLNIQNSFKILLICR